MDKEKAQGLLTLYGSPAVKVGEKTISFARQTKDDVNGIEKMSDHDLVEQWKALTFMNYIAGNVSLNDMQRIDLLELEMTSRDSIDKEELEKWSEEAYEAYNNSEESQF